MMISTVSLGFCTSAAAMARIRDDASRRGFDLLTQVKVGVQGPLQLPKELEIASTMTLARSHAKPLGLPCTIHAKAKRGKPSESTTSARQFSSERIRSCHMACSIA